MKEEKNIDDLFRSSFEDFEVAPPAAVKEAIDRKIGGRPSRKRFWGFFLLALLAGTGAFAYMYTTSAPEKTQLAATPASRTTATQSIRRGGSSESAAGPSDSGSAAARKSGLPASGNSSKTNGTTAQQTTANGRPVSSSVGASASTKKTTKKGTTAKVGTSGKTTGGKQATPIKGKTGGKEGASSSGESSGTASGKSTGPSSSGSGSSGGSDPIDPNDGKSAGPAANSGGDPQTPPTDSVPKKEDPKEPEKKLSDSTSDPATKKPENKNGPSSEPWRASVYLGPQFGLNSIKIPTETQRLAEKPASFQFSGEINRSLFAGYGLSSGVLYNTKRTETFEWDTYVYGDSTLTTEWEYIYGNPNFPDSITDSVLVDVWVYDSTALTGAQINSISMFGIPLFVTKQFEFGNNWALLVNAGAQFNFYNVKLGSADSVPVTQTVNDFSVALLARAHLAYRWNQWQFSAGLNGGFDMRPAVIYEGIDRRRYFLTPQIGIHFIF